MNYEYLTKESEVKRSKVMKEVMKNYDKVFLNTIVKRQFLVLKDLFVLHDEYPSIISADIVGSLDSMFKLLEDVRDSAIARQ